MRISHNKLIRTICDAAQSDSDRAFFNSLKVFNFKDVYNYIVCSYI